MREGWSNQLNVIIGLNITIGNNSEYCTDIAADQNKFHVQSKERKTPEQIPSPAPDM